MLKIVLLFAIILYGSVSAQTYPDKTVDSLLKKGLKDLIRQDYAASKKTFKELDRLYPELPLGKVYFTGTYIAEAYDMAEEFDTDLINKNLEAATELAEKLVENDPDNVWNLYMLAVTKGHYAYYEALTEDWLGALSDGFGAVSNFQKCLEINPSFYETYTAIGTYMYWKTRKTDFLTWLPFVEDDREEGISYLEKAVRSSSYNYYHAIYSLQWIYIDAGQPQSAVKISEKALKDFPGSRFFKWGYARALQDVDMNAAIKVYSDILNSYPSIGNHFNEIRIKLVMAQLYQKLNKKEKAIALCNEILAIKNISAFVKERLGDRLQKVKALREDLQESK